MYIRFSDYENAVDQFTLYMKEYEQGLTDLVKHMEAVVESGLISGESHDEAAWYVECLRIAEEMPKGLADGFKSTVLGFLEELDSIQTIDGEAVLYDRKYEGLRDYSNEMFASLSDVAERSDPDEGFWCYIWEILEDKVGFYMTKAYDLLPDFLPFVIKFNFITVNTSVESTIQSAQKNLMQYKDVTKRRLHNIYTESYDAEKRVANRLFNIAETLDKLGSYLNELRTGLKVTDGNVKIENHQEIERLKEGILSLYQQFRLETPLSDEQICEFIESDEYNEHFYDDNRTNIREGIDEVRESMDLGTDPWEFVKTTALIGFDLAKQKALSLIRKEDYDAVILEKEVLSMLKAEAKSYDIDKQGWKKTYDEIYKMLDKFNSYDKKDFDKNYEGDRRYKVYKDKIKQFETNSKILKLLEGGKLGMEIVASILTDYTRNIELLDSLQANCSGDERLKRAYQKVRTEYENHLFDAANRAMDFGLDHMTDMVTSNLDKALNVSVMAVVGGVEGALDVAGKVTGEGDVAEARYALISYEGDLMNSTGDALSKALQTLSVMEKTDPNYQNAVNDVRNTFCIYRRNVMSAYEKLAAATSGTKSEYYSFLANHASKMTLSDLMKNDVISYEEYMKKDLKTW